MIRKFFARPRPAIAYLRDRYGFGERRVLDIGSSYGMTLLCWGADSEGIEIDPHMASLPEALGYRMHRINIEDGLPDGPFDAVFSNNLFEHVVAPHLFLMRIRNALEDGGLLALGHPSVPPAPLRAVMGRRLNYRGYAASEHVNFFTPTTVRLTVERAGFEVLEQVLPRRGFTIRRMIWAAPHCYTIARRITAWHYPDQRRADFDPQGAAKELRRYHPVTP